MRIIDCLEKNLQTSYRIPPLYFSHPSVESQLARKTDTVTPIATQSPRPRKTHDRIWPPRGQHSIRGNRRKDTQAVRNRERTCKHNQRETTYVMMTGERTRKQHNGNNRRTSGKKFCVRTLHMACRKCLDAQNATRQGILHPDNACQCTYCTERDLPVHVHTRQKWAAYWPSGRLMSR